MKVNKFNPKWQLTRMNAKKIKDVNAKIKLVMDYYKNNKTISDLNRVLNWLRMTKLPYKASPEKQHFFDVAINKIKDDKLSKFDNDSKISDLSPNEIDDLLIDLNKRDYKFQMQGKIPKAHIEFVNSLKKI